MNTNKFDNAAVEQFVFRTEPTGINLPNNWIVRTLITACGEVWFMAMDVCRVLDIRTNNLRAILDDDEIAVLPNDYSVGIGGKAPLIISEAGLYSLVLRSRKPEAKPFRRWVTHEVLPAIRKTGGYIPVKEGESPDLILARAVKVADTTLVDITDGKVVTTSLKIAEVFGKQHKDVLKAIYFLDCSKDFHERNFAPMSHDVKIGNGATRKSAYYSITRDGFAFLVMGFTGKVAAQWKERYIAAFNAGPAGRLQPCKLINFIDHAARLWHTLSHLSSIPKAGLPTWRASMLLRLCGVEVEVRRGSFFFHVPGIGEGYVGRGWPFTFSTWNHLKELEKRRAQRLSPTGE